MSKELPYFQFEPAEYLTKDVSFCSLAAQGLFVNICCYYWQRNCELTKDQLLKRINKPEELQELEDENVVKIINGKIKISFLKKQYEQIVEKSRINKANGAKGGRPKNPNKTEQKPKENPIKSESKGIREDNIKGNNTTLKESKEVRANKFATRMKEVCKESKDKYSVDMLNAFYSYWTESSENGKKMRFEKQPVFNVKRRLETWKAREKTGPKKPSPHHNITGNEDYDETL